MTTAAPLTSLGREITFADGTTARLRYSLGSIALLEQRHGGIDGVLSVFEKIDGQSGMTGVIIGPMLELVGAGLTGSGGFVPHITERVTTVREETPDGRKTSRDVREITAVRYVRQKDRAELGDLLDFRDFEGLVDAMTAAFAEAFPQGEAEAPAGAPVTEVTIPDTFRGTNSSTSEPSPLDAPTPLSGS
ncbi:hypothetical protein [Streptomyces scopuliridis]|uniref:Uncharacterized protein n=1 Tax=Streptomyces scopuliridis RB72 TaxID=1440053 RepID=A0A2T7SP25_9ACTN|nr:hypothetical protein [Streptomyces scopuliridis]PVE04663.1 hypothetical protein Y717_10735 [Streptomyces scopuliridis RB72]